MRKKPICKKWQLNPADRLSDLPDTVVHHIIFFLDLKDACRTCVLSKRWNRISDTNLVMDLFHDERGMGLCDESRVLKFDRFLEYTNRRMKRYSRQILPIRKLRLGFPIRKSKFRNTRIPLENKAEDWVKTAVCNQLEELALTGPKNYKDECADVELGEEELDEDDLGDARLGPPCDIRELKLTLSSWVLSQCYISAFLEGVFWSCHPRIFSIRVNLKDLNLSIQPLIQKLQDMASCWKHPLKRVEEKGANCFDLLMTRKLDVQLILHW